MLILDKHTNFSDTDFLVLLRIEVSKFEVHILAIFAIKFGESDKIIFGLTGGVLPVSTSSVVAVVLVLIYPDQSRFPGNGRS